MYDLPSLMIKWITTWKLQSKMYLYSYVQNTNTHNNATTFDAGLQLEQLNISRKEHDFYTWNKKN